MQYEREKIGAVVLESLEELTKERDSLVNEAIEHFKDMDENSDEVKFISNTIIKYNIIIKSLEHIVEQSTKR